MINTLMLFFSVSVAFGSIFGLGWLIGHPSKLNKPMTIFLFASSGFFATGIIVLGFFIEWIGV